MERGNMPGAFGFLLHYFNNKKNVDVTIRVQHGERTEEFFCHKIVLKLWSPVFEDHLVKSNDITIADVSQDIIKALLKFLYGSKEDIKNKENDVQFIFSLYKAAETYEIQELKNVCYRILIQSSIDYNNVFELLEAAEYVKIKALKSGCIEFLQSETNEILSSREIKNVTAFMVKSVLTLTELKLESEYELLSWVFEWAESEYQRCQEKNQTTHLGIIHPFLSYLNFTCLEGIEFAKLVDNHKEFFNDKDCFCIFMNILYPDTTITLPYWHRNEISRKYSKKINSSTTDNEGPSLENNASSNTHSEDAVCATSSVLLELDGEECADVKSFAAQHVIEPDAEKLNTRKLAEEPDNLKVTVDKPDNSKVTVEKSDDSKINIIKPKEEPKIPSFNTVWHSCINGNNAEPLMEYDSDCSYDLLEEPVKCRKKIKKRKLKTRYLIPGGERKVLKSCESWSSQYSSGEFDSLVAEIWKQQKYSSHLGV